MAMKHIQTTIGETTIHIVMPATAAKATEWLEFKVPIEPLTVPAAGGDFPFGDLQLRHLATIRPGSPSLCARRNRRGNSAPLKSRPSHCLKFLRSSARYGLGMARRGVRLGGGSWEGLRALRRKPVHPRQWQPGPRRLGGPGRAKIDLFFKTSNGTDNSAITSSIRNLSKSIMP